MQGFVGGMPWNAIGFATMYLQLLGFTDVAAASLTALFWGGTALGNILGGLVGDLLVKPLPNVGRQLTCQVRRLTCSVCQVAPCMCRNIIGKIQWRYQKAVCISGLQVVGMLERWVVVRAVANALDDALACATSVSCDRHPCASMVES